MPVYTYKGTNRSGNSVSGEATATSKADLQNQLKRQQHHDDEGVRKGQRVQHADLRRRRELEGIGDLHATILGDD